MPLNSKFNEKINEEMEHTFSICDLDGIIRKEFWYDERKTRLIIYEKKWITEKLTETQYLTLIKLYKSIEWSEYDTESGVYLFQTSNDMNKIIITEIWGMEIIADISFKQLEDWFNGRLNLKHMKGIE